MRSGRLRAGPSGEERCTPHHMVPVSPQCPREIDLLPLPPTVLQGTAVSSERISQHPHRFGAMQGCLPPLRRSLEQLDRLAAVVHQRGGYRIQFGSRAASAHGSSHSGGPQAGSGYGTGSKHSLEEGGRRGGPSSCRESGFYSWYCTVTKKDGERLRSRSVSAEPRCHVPQDVPEVRFGGKAYQNQVLPSGLELLPRTFTKCVDAALAPLRLQGIRILNHW
ncbi:Dystrophin [Labeo rohita]|uniref:Dystrophin n=1 Tax=Labeo rohita TaxID=84645 RepID=A0ABQ8MUY5_LABRO|nr:Dystrophin [Labeo rohita]